MKYYCGIDVGGTKIYSIIINEKGAILGRSKEKLEANFTLYDLIKKIKFCYENALRDSLVSDKEIKAIGIAVPSAVNVDKGLLIHAPNLNLKNIELTKLLYKEINIPLYMDNDANMGTYGEYTLGNAKGVDNVYGIFIGTGIGGGYVVNGTVERGLNFTAGEIGHMIIEINGPRCGCGRKGCLEAIAGKSGITNHIKFLEEKYAEKSVLNKINPKWKKKKFGSSDLKKAYDKSDKIVIEAINRAGKAIGISIANIINLIGVEAIVLGGGLYNKFKNELNPLINRYIMKYSIGDGAKGVKILESKLLDDAVSLGVAWFVRLPENKNLLYNE